MKQIPLTQGKFALVDDEDFEWLSQWKWCAQKAGENIYAVRDGKFKDGFHQTIRMHRAILDLTDPSIFCDHVDGNGLNNQRDNLRRCCHAENSRNINLSKRNKSGFKGVSWYKSTSKWVAMVRVNGKGVHLGYFSDIADAARAYNEAALKHHGNFANLNIVEPLLPVRSRSVLPSNNTSGFRGVMWNRRTNRWEAEIRVKNKLKRLGWFSDPKKAALAYNMAALEYHGKSARLNPL